MFDHLRDHIVSSIVGDVIGGLLFPGSSRPQPGPSEGMWNASLGSVAAFIAGIAAGFCGISTWAVLIGVREPWLWLVLAGSVMLAIPASVLAYRALRVSRRRRALARIGLWLSRATIVAGLLAALAAVAGITVPGP